MGWDTSSYVLGLLSIQSNGLLSLIIEAPLRVGYFVPEVVFDFIFKLDPYKAEIYFPLFLAGSVAPLFYVLVRLSVGNILTASITGILSLVWNGYTRLVRDLHSNLLYLDIVLLVTCLTLLYYREKRSTVKISLGTAVGLLILLGFASYPLSIILIAAAVMVFLDSILNAIKSHQLISDFKSELKASWPYLAPIVVFIPFLLIDLRYIVNTIQAGVWSGGTSGFLAPTDLSSLALIDPRSNTSLILDGWIGYGNMLGANSVSIVSIALTFFAVLGIIYLIRRSLRTVDATERRVFTFLAWLAIIISLSALCASLMGLFLPPWRALNDIPLPLFSGLGIGWTVEFFTEKHPSKTRRIVSALSFICIILILSVTLLPFQINYSIDGNTAGHFNQNDLNDVLQVKSWLISHNASKPWIIIDPITDSPDYVQLDIDVAQTYFGDSPTLAYYGNLPYLMNWTLTPTSDPNRLQYSIYYFSILNATATNRDGTVLLMDFLYPTDNLSSHNASQIGICCYALSLKSN